MKEKYGDFQKKLEKVHTWPSLYMFKFIAPKGKEDQLKKIFPKNEFIQRESKEGNYFSLTFKILVNSSDEVIRIYEKVNKIEGVIAL